MYFFHDVFSKIFVAVTNMKIEIMIWSFHIYTELLSLLVLLVEASFSLKIFYIRYHFSFYLFKRFFTINNSFFYFLNILIRKSRRIPHIRFNCIKLSLNVLFVFSVSIYASSSFCIETLCSFWLFYTVLTIFSIRILKRVVINFAWKVK
jgi:hypothetical protein